VIFIAGRERIGEQGRDVPIGLGRRRSAGGITSPSKNRLFRERRTNITNIMWMKIIGKRLISLNRSELRTYANKHSKRHAYFDPRKCNWQCLELQIVVTGTPPAHSGKVPRTAQRPFPSSATTIHHMIPEHCWRIGLVWENHESAPEVRPFSIAIVPLKNVLQNA
jgi:hypothetical protein